MYCIKCGKQIPEGRRFCISCGAPVRGGASEANVYCAPKGKDQSGYAPQPPGSGKKGGKKTLITAVAIFMAVVLVAGTAFVLSAPAASLRSSVSGSCEISDSVRALGAQETQSWTSSVKSEAPDGEGGMVYTVSGDNEIAKNAREGEVYILDGGIDGSAIKVTGVSQGNDGSIAISTETPALADMFSSMHANIQKNVTGADIVSVDTPDGVTLEGQNGAAVSAAAPLSLVAAYYPDDLTFDIDTTLQYGDSELSVQGKVGMKDIIVDCVMDLEGLPEGLNQLKMDVKYTKVQNSTIN
jgi:hypothetical protein